MTIGELIAKLEHIKETAGDIPVQLQDDGQSGVIINRESFFVVLEEYDIGWICNLRWWPY